MLVCVCGSLSCLCVRCVFSLSFVCECSVCLFVCMVRVLVCVLFACVSFSFVCVCVGCVRLCFVFECSVS